jgi:hypothetical protein
MDELKAHGWNIEQILVYVWHCMGDELSGEEYPYTKFANSEMGQRLRIELSALASPPASAPGELTVKQVRDSVVWTQDDFTEHSTVDWEESTRRLNAHLQRESQPLVDARGPDNPDHYGLDRPRGTRDR